MSNQDNFVIYYTDDALKSENEGRSREKWQTNVDNCGKIVEVVMSREEEEERITLKETLDELNVVIKVLKAEIEGSKINSKAIGELMGKLKEMMAVKVGKLEQHAQFCARYGIVNNYTYKERPNFAFAMGFLGNSVPSLKEPSDEGEVDQLIPAGGQEKKPRFIETISLEPSIPKASKYDKRSNTALVSQIADLLKTASDPNSRSN
uniref:BAG domain-containing protein n=1 Tax=Rhabditophanes sp. KR3021 TaxID=114890 RepID=A0AC35TGC8_9BILA